MPNILELTCPDESVMWIVGPGHMVSENTSRGIHEPQVNGKCPTVRADNWLFHLEQELVDGIQFVETFGDVTSYYFRFSDHAGADAAAGLPTEATAGWFGGNSEAGNPEFEGMRARYGAMAGVEPVRREVPYIQSGSETARTSATAIHCQKSHPG